MFLPKLFFSDLHHVDHSTAKRVWSATCTKHWLSLVCICAPLITGGFLIEIYLPEIAIRLWGEPSMLTVAVIATLICAFAVSLLRSKLEAEIKLQLGDLVKQNDHLKEEL